MTNAVEHLSRQLIEQADAMHAVAARVERADTAIRSIASLVDALPEVEPNSVMMVSVKAQTIRALREATEEWRTKA